MQIKEIELEQKESISNEQAEIIGKAISKLCEISESLRGIELIIDLYSSVSKDPVLSKIAQERVTEHLYNQTQYINSSIEECASGLVDIEEEIKK